MATFLFIVVLVIACIIFIPKIKRASERAAADEKRKKEEDEARAKADEFKLLEQSALQGDVSVQYQLGERCRSDGKLKEAVKWLKMAADNGHEKAKEVLPVVIEDHKSRLEKDFGDYGKQILDIAAVRKVGNGKCLTCMHLFRRGFDGNPVYLYHAEDFADTTRIHSAVCNTSSSPYYDSPRYPTEGCSAWDACTAISDEIFMMLNDRIEELKKEMKEYGML
jgi:TPR repeat protein